MTPSSGPDRDVPQYANSDEPRFPFLEYWRILVRRRLIVLGVLALAVIVTMVFTWLTPPVYEATTIMEISRHTPAIVEFTDVLSSDSNAFWEFHQTQQRILQSRTVAGLAAERLDLQNRPEFASRKGSPLGRSIGWARSLLSGSSQQATPPTVDAAVGFVRGNLSINAIPKSNLVSVSFRDGDPGLAADVANAVASAYQEFQLDARYNTTGQAKEFLTKDVARVQSEISLLEGTLQAYGVEKEILALSDGTQDISEQAMAEINRRYTEAKGSLAAAEARYKSLQQAVPEGLPEVLNSPTIGHLRQRHAEMEREHGQMSRRFKHDWPPLVQIREELVQAEEQLEAEAENIARHVRAVALAEYHTAQAEFRAFTEQRDEQKLEVRRVNEDAIDYAALKAEIDTKRMVLGDLVTRQSETETSFRLRETGTSNVRVVDSAQAPRYPVKPNKAMNLLISILFGLSMGAAMAFLADHLDNTVKGEQDIEHVADLTVLGHVPLTQSLNVANREPGKAGTNPLDLACHLDSRSHFSETFRNLRTSLLLATPDRPPRHVLVTSCQPEDGKSTVALNLAIALTQLGRRVLLVDADLRRPRIHKALGLKNRVGLSSFLSGNTDTDDLVVETEVPNLSVILAGPIPPNPSELLGAPRLDVLLGSFLDENKFDHLILDSPPLLSVTDSIVLSSRTDSTVVVVRAGSTRREALAQSAARLRQSRSNVIGAVLNAVPEGTGYGYRSYWYRRHYYGNDEAPTTKSEKRRRTRGRKAG